MCKGDIYQHKTTVMLSVHAISEALFHAIPRVHFYIAMNSESVYHYILCWCI